MEWESLSNLIDALGGNSAEVRRRAMLDQVSLEVVAEGLSRSARYAMDHPEAEDPPFEQWDAIPPGGLDVRVFDQGIWWVDVCVDRMR